ncbi:MAG TPA: ergothioneine biosynthesis protein EgtC [Acidimicrobiia bacterium]|nr:ergothioneine biosynthesis protein EgtC [Acidimicrobiia bacterium]
MCRHLAYLGQPVALHELLFGAPHSLCRQASAPVHQTSGDSNPDGWGAGWYVDGDVEPHQYRTTTPIWDDAVFADSSRVIESGALLAAARLASEGATIHESGNAPFRSGRWLFSLNGYVKNFHRGVGDRLRSRLSASRRAALVGDSDSEVLFALVLDRLDLGRSATAALCSVIEEVNAVSSGRLNMLLTDGHHVVGTRLGNSLFVREATVASEPLDDAPGWREVPDGSLVEVAAAHAVAPTITAL